MTYLCSTIKTKEIEKKYWFIFAAVVLFFGGAIWVSEAPIWAPLVAFLEVAGGFACGFFFKKFQTELKLNILKDQNISMTDEIASLKSALKQFKAEKQEKSKTAKSKKNKE